MMGTQLKMLMGENASEKYNQVQVKKLTVPSNEATTKHATLGDLQNRGLSLGLTTKEAAKKKLKDVKLTKARVDTYWKKQPLGVNNANAAPKPNAGGAIKTTAAPLLRFNSMRTNAAGEMTRQISSTALQAGRIAAATTAATTIANAKVAAADANSKLATSVKQKSGSDEKLNTLRRKDSNLLRKSLTKLRVALSKPNLAPAAAAAQPKAAAAQPKTAAAQPKTAAVSLVRSPRAHSKTAGAASLLKKDVFAKKKPVALARRPKLPVLPPTTITEKPPAAMSLSSKRLAEVEDIDADDRDNPMLVSEYANDIYDYLYQLEDEQPIYKNHLANQLEVSHKMRAVLIDWINECHLQFNLAAETFYLGVAIIDSYLQVVKNTKRKHLRLVGITALFIATKYEELIPRPIGHFVFITGDAYTGLEIRQMELQILKAIDINLSRPLPIHFLRRYSKAANAEDEHHAMSKYFLELAAMDYELASFKPSEIAAGSLYLSLQLINGNARAATGFNPKHWTPTLVHYSRYTATDLRIVTRKIAKLARDAPTGKLKAIYNKYRGNKFQKIALHTDLSGPLIDSIAGQEVSEKESQLISFGHCS